MKNNMTVVYCRKTPDSGETYNFVRDLGITCKEVFKTIPNGCVYCGKDHMRGMEVYGAGEGVLFWICDDCEGLLLRYSKSITEQKLLLATQVYTSSKDWLMPNDGEALD